MFVFGEKQVLIRKMWSNNFLLVRVIASFSYVSRLYVASPWHSIVKRWVSPVCRLGELLEGRKEGRRLQRWTPFGDLFTAEVHLGNEHWSLLSIGRYYHCQLRPLSYTRTQERRVLRLSSCITHHRRHHHRHRLHAAIHCCCCCCCC